LTAIGGVKCWGYNASGQLGDGSTRTKAVPVSVSGLSSGIAAVTAGGYHTCAVTTGGSVKCWGDNYSGQLGIGSTDYPRITPVDVSGLSSGVTAIAAGEYHTCALTTAGGVKCWGANSAGQLGNGANEYARNTPVDVSGLSSDVIAIAAGGGHTCALTAAGGVKCWGNNSNGQLGDGTTSGAKNMPVDVSGLSSGVTAIVVGGQHTCALTLAGSVKCWGANNYNQLGDGTAGGTKNTPVDVSGLSSGIAAIAAGVRHTCVLTTSGSVKCWGANNYGQLGNGVAGSSKNTPVNVSGLDSAVAGVSAGGYHTCTLIIGGGVSCWGDNVYSQLGDGVVSVPGLPLDTSGLTSGMAAVVAGGYHSCALTMEGSVKCWGWNSSGQLGDGTFDNKNIPVDVNGLTGAVTVVTGGNHTCALTVEGGVTCWGANNAGQLGDGTTGNPKNMAVPVSGLSSGVTAIATGLNHTCAVTTIGGVKCWGANHAGQLGDGTADGKAAPVDVSGLRSGVAAIVAGGTHTCALTMAGAVKCWGANSAGQLGDGTTSSSKNTPVDVSSLKNDVAAIAAGSAHTCALTIGGGAKCWGDNDEYGQLGSGSTDVDQNRPVDVNGLSSGVVAITSGNFPTCALTAGGRSMCWGNNEDGQLGDGTMNSRSTAKYVTRLNSGVTAISAGGYHTCALSTGGVKCWGWNNSG